MRKLLNTLFITLPDAYLTREGNTIVVRADDEDKFKIPIINLESIVCFNYQGMSPALMRLCVENNVSVSFLNQYGKFLARITGPVKGNVVLRKLQFRNSENEEACVNIAVNMIAGKIANCRYVLHRGVRDHGEKIQEDIVQESYLALADSYKNLKKASSLATIRGIEGEAASRYFSSLDHLILNQKDDFFMRERSRRPPLDRFNALLSFLYSLLHLDIVAALETVGLDPAVGFLHRDRSGRNSLALDIMEELRPYLADRLAITLINRKQIKADDFVIKESGAVLMNESCRKDVMAAYHRRKQEQIIHPFIDEKISIGLIPHIQAMLLARFLRGDIEGYPPFLCK